MKKSKIGFTLIEIVVSVAIFSIIIISMISIYILSSETSLKSDINRAMHENTKNIVSEIYEDTIRNSILGVSQNVLDSCSFSTSFNYKSGNKLCIGTNDYYVAKEDLGIYTRIDDLTYCQQIDSQCYIVKKSPGLDPSPLTNSLVTIKSLDFKVSKSFVPKVTMNIVLQPTIKAGVRPSLIEQNKLILETTISNRPF
ncbi:MAG: prepilin-type N-terminal cleavage/methylation domain-containing protein [Candidatus Gracilibacteria bacterium]|nr:prepilin-type N-terminal cleavage/methylation domain-containing protein [Candidatus Gracilibacteria bacterium]